MWVEEDTPPVEEVFRLVILFRLLVLDKQFKFKKQMNQPKKQPPPSVGSVPWISYKPPGEPDRYHRRYLQSQRDAVATPAFNINTGSVPTTGNRPAGRGRSRRTKKNKRKTLRRK